MHVSHRRVSDRRVSNRRGCHGYIFQGGTLGVHLLSKHLIGGHLVGRASRGRASYGHTYLMGVDLPGRIATLILPPGSPPRHTTVLGGMWWCVMVAPNGSDVVM
jgi:hypothetical protein